MSFTAFTNVITILFCLAVLVQSVRLLRSLKQVREAQLDRTVGALDTATGKARAVLSELKGVLTKDGAANLRAVSEAREVREELNMMIGIANTMADRLVEAASSKAADEGQEPASAPAQAAAKTRTTRPRTTKPKKTKPTKAATARTKKTKAPAKSVAAGEGTTTKAAPRRTTPKAPARATGEKEAA